MFAIGNSPKSRYKMILRTGNNKYARNVRWRQTAFDFIMIAKAGKKNKQTKHKNNKKQ